MTAYAIRPFHEGDRAAVTEFRNAGRPAHLQETAAEWQRGDARAPTEEVRLRLCAVDDEDRPIAYLSAVDRGTSAWRKPGVCGVGLWVSRDFRRQGLGGTLYEKAVAFAHARGATRVTAFVRFYEPDEPAAHFLAKRGFTEIDREVPVMLDLKAFPRAQFVPPAPEGIRFLSYAEAGDTDESRQKLYALETRLDRDVPTNDVHPEPPPFDHWAKSFETPEWDPNALILAAEGEDWIGLSQLGFQEHTNIAWTFLTGVLPEHRGRGIAYALKLRAIDAAIQRGSSLILTENHEDNAPMRAINRKLGFVLDAPGVSYSKDL